MSKLFVFRVEFDVVIQAGDVDGAALVAEEAVEKGCHQGGAVAFLREATEVKHLPPDWRHQWPYGDEEDRTCAEILEQTK